MPFLDITGPRGPDHTFEATITEKGLSSSRTANAASLAPGAAAGPAAAGQGKKRPRDKKAREYSYLQIRALPERSSAAQQDLCFFGVVSDYTLPCVPAGQALGAGAATEDDGHTAGCDPGV